MLRLRTFGGLSIERSSPESGSATPAGSATAARRRLAVLAVLAASSPRGVPRDRLLALFWPESDSDRARHALDQTLYALKRDLGADALVVGREEPALNPATIASDVGDFKAALARGDRAAAIELYAGPFLDGVFISGAPEFERWVEEERARLTREVELALEALAVDAARSGDHAASVQRWQRLAGMEPRKTRVVLALMSELAAAGDRATALRHAEIYHTLVKDDLDAVPNPAVAALAERLKREPPAARADLAGRADPSGATRSRDDSDGVARPRDDSDGVTRPRDDSDAAMRLRDDSDAAMRLRNGSGSADTSVALVEAPPTPPVSPLLPVPAVESPRRPSLTVEWLRRRTTRAYRIAGAAVAFAVLLGLTLAWVLANRRHDLARGWLLVADVENRTNEPIFDRALDAALATGLQQSPDVEVFPRANVQQTLIRMTRPGDARLDEVLAREVAEREGIRVVLATAIDRLDSSYLLTARIVDASSGVALAAESGVAKQRADVIDVVGDLVRRVRRDIGESSSAIARHDLPLPQATTASLDALRKYADGLAASRAGQRPAAMELWREAVAIDSNFALAHAELGAAYYWNNDRPNGDAHFEHALRLLDRLTDRERLTIRAAAESWRGNREGAIELRRALLALYPNDRITWGKIGYDYMRLGRTQEAIAAIRQQLARDSSSPNDYINLATSYTGLGEYDESIRSYRRAFSIQPSLLTYGNLNHEYGRALVLAGRLQEARAVYDTMMHGDRDQQARGHRSLGLLAMVEGRYATAVDRFQQAVLLSQAPDHALTLARNRLFLASAEREKGWSDSAHAELQAVYDLFRTSYMEPAFLVLVGKALTRDGQLRLAAEVLDSLRRRSRSTNKDDRANELVLGAEVALGRGRADSAVHLLRLAYAYDSGAVVTESLARALAASGDATGSVRLYERLGAAMANWYGWEPEQDGLTAPLAAAALYERIGDHARARTAYERQIAQWTTADSDLVSLRQARAGAARLRGLEYQRELRR